MLDNQHLYHLQKGAQERIIIVAFKFRALTVMLEENGCGLNKVNGKEGMKRHIKWPHVINNTVDNMAQPNNFIKSKTDFPI